MVQGQPGKVHLVRRCAVLGSPIAHSLSPAIHQAAYAWLGLDWEYQRHLVEAEELAGFVAGLDRSWRGLSCTMPLKHAVVALGTADSVVQTLGVGNTVVFDGHPGDVSTTRVYNTDVPGLVSALRAAGAQDVSSAVLVGNGATARSILLALSELGVTRATVLARNPDKTRDLAGLGEPLGIEVTHLDLGATPSAADLVVSTVPAETSGRLAPALTADTVFDAVYDPWPTPLAADAARRGLRVVSGLDLLVHQAVGQVELFTGRTVPADLLLEAARDEQARRHQPDGSGSADPR